MKKEVLCPDLSGRWYTYDLREQIDGKSTWPSFFFTSTWLSAIIKRISPREKQWTVVCVILNIAGAILTHVLHTLTFRDPQRVKSLFVRFDPVRSALRLAGY